MARCIRCSGRSELIKEAGMCAECCTEALCIDCWKWMPVEEIDDYGSCEKCKKENKDDGNS